jgi:hypothetical protein
MVGSSIPGLADTATMDPFPFHDLWPYNADFDW